MYYRLQFEACVICWDQPYLCFSQCSIVDLYIISVVKFDEFQFEFTIASENCICNSTLDTVSFKLSYLVIFIENFSQYMKQPFLHVTSVCCCTTVLNKVYDLARCTSLCLQSCVKVTNSSHDMGALLAIMM